MPWIEKKNDWLGRNNDARTKKKSSDEKESVEQLYTVTQVAKIMSVSNKTVKKWLGIDEPENAVIDPKDWFRITDRGDIRIFERAVLKLQGKYR